MTNNQVTIYITNVPKEQKEIMEAIRNLIHQHVENVTEEFKWSRPIFKSTKDFAYLQANKHHINLGFYGGFEKLLSIFTANEGGIIRIIPMKVHLRK